MTDREQLLMNALEAILVANNVLTPNQGPNGPELLNAAKDFVDHINSDKAMDREWFEKYGIRWEWESQVVSMK